MPQESITLLICTHNRGERIRETLDAVYAMDTVGGRVAQLLIIDNASSDETPRVVDEIIASGPPIPTTRIEEPNLGAIHARRRAVREAQTPIIAWLDDDVIPNTDWARVILARMDQQPRAGVVGSRIALRWESGPTALAQRCSGWLAEQDFGETPKLLTDPGSGFATAALAARKQAILDSKWLEHGFLCGPNGEQLSRGEDYEMVIRVRQAGWEVWYESGTSVKHLIPAGRQTRAYLAKLAFGIGESNAWLDWLAKDKPGREWVQSNLRRVRRRYRKTLMLEWRPGRRFTRLHERRGQLQGLAMLREHLSQPMPGDPAKQG